MEVKLDGSPTCAWIWANDLLIAQVDDIGTIHYAHTDELGNLIALSDSAGHITDQFAYDPYGKLISRTGTTDIPFTWLADYGVVSLGNDLYATLHRTYHAGYARFLSKDPIGLQGGLNLYAYGDLNPLFYVDYLGLCAKNSDSSIWQNLDLYGAMIETASDGWGKGGVIGNAQGNIYSGLHAVLDIVGGSAVQNTASLSGSAAGEGRTGAAIGGGVASVGIATLNAYSGAQSASALSKVSTYAQNPVLYEIGAKTLPSTVYDDLGLSALSQIEKGAVITESLYQGSKTAAFLTPVPTTAYGKTIWTGLTPGGAYVLGGATAVVNDKFKP